MDIIIPNPYGQLSYESLSMFEKKLGARLPDSYRQFLLQFNGGKWSKKLFHISNEYGNSLIHHVYGIHDGPGHCQLDSAFERFKSIIEDCCLPIADDDGGNEICIGIHDKNRGKIYFWDHETGALILMALTFDEFVDSLSDIPVGTSEVDIILEADDVSQMGKLISSGYDIEILDEYGTSLIERAAIKAKPNLIEYLAHKGANLRNSLEYAKKNAGYFDKHKIIVELLVRLHEEGNK